MSVSTYTESTHLVGAFDAVLSAESAVQDTAGARIRHWLRDRKAWRDPVMHEQDMESFEALKPEAWGRGRRNANSNSEEGHPEWDRSRAAVQRTKSLAHFSGTYEPGTILHSILRHHRLAFRVLARISNHR